MKKNLFNTDNFIRTELIGNPKTKFSKLIIKRPYYPNIKSKIKNLKPFSEISKIDKFIQNRSNKKLEDESYYKSKLKSAKNLIHEIKSKEKDKTERKMNRTAKLKGFEITESETNIRTDGLKQKIKTGVFIYGSSQGYYYNNFQKIHGIEKEIKDALDL